MFGFAPNHRLRIIYSALNVRLRNVALFRLEGDTNMPDNKVHSPKFITTFNPDTAALLSHMGFKQLQKTQSGYFVFVNEPKKMVFEKLDDVAYTNTLFFN